MSTTSPVFDIAIFGETNVGKTSLLKKNITGEFIPEYHPSLITENYKLNYYTNYGNITFNVTIPIKKEFEIDVEKDKSCELREKKRKREKLSFESFYNKSLRDSFQNDRTQKKDELFYGIILMFDASMVPTKDSINNLYLSASEFCQDQFLLIVVLNKIDLITPDQTKLVSNDLHTYLSTLHKKHESCDKIELIQMSVKSSFNIDKPFLILAQNLVGQPNLDFVESPALAPPEINICQSMLEQYERELLQAETIPLPVDEDEDDELSFSVSGSTFTTASSSELVSSTLGDISNSSPTTSVCLVNRSNGSIFTPSLLSVSSDINDMNSKVSVRLDYSQLSNLSSDQPFELVFSIPIDESAAVCGFEAVINNRKVVGVVKEKEEAIRTYEDGLSKGHKASLVEREKGDIFKTSLGNILSSDSVSITLRYVSHLSPDYISKELQNNPSENKKEEKCVIRFTLPTAIGPLYSPPGYLNTISRSVDFLTTKFDFEALIQMCGPIKSISSPNFMIECDYNIKQNDNSVARVIYSNYKHSLNQLETNAIRDKIESRGDFTIYIEIQENFIHKPRLSLEYDHQRNSYCAHITLFPNLSTVSFSENEIIFLVDGSGSMDGARIVQTKKALKTFLKPLLEEQQLLKEQLFLRSSKVYFNICVFNEKVQQLFPKSVKASMRNILNANNFIDSISPFGGTDILPALMSVLDLHNSSPYSSQLLPISPEIPRQVILITDGEVSNTEEVIKYVRTKREYTRVWTFGIGNTPSHELIKGLARAGNGNYYFVADTEDFSAKVNSLWKQLSLPSLSSISMSVDPLFSVIQQSPSRFPVIPSYSHLSVFIIFKIEENIEEEKKKGNINMKFYLEGKEESIEFCVDLTNPSKIKKDSTLHTLAARLMISELTEGISSFHDDKGYIKSELFTTLQSLKDKGQENFVKDRIIELGCSYQLMSKYTSFVLVDERSNDCVIGSLKLVK